MNSDRLGVSPYLQGLAALALVVWIASQVYPFVGGDKKLGAPAKAKEQMVYILSPGNNNTPEKLQGLIDEGWRVTNVSVAGCPLGLEAEYRFLLVLEHPETKENSWWYVNPYDPKGHPKLLLEQLKKGLKITQVSSAATGASAGWTYRTVFVLER